MPAGKNACIVGGGSVGCETALYLARKGWSVTVMEMLADVATDLHEANRDGIWPRSRAALRRTLKSGEFCRSAIRASVGRLGLGGMAILSIYPPHLSPSPHKEGKGRG